MVDAKLCWTRPTITDLDRAEIESNPISAVTDSLDLPSS